MSAQLAPTTAPLGRPATTFREASGVSPLIALNTTRKCQTRESDLYFLPCLSFTLLAQSQVFTTSKYAEVKAH